MPNTVEFLISNPWLFLELDIIPVFAAYKNDYVNSMRIFESFRAKKRQENAAANLYVAAVEQARSQAFFLDMGIPDTVDGRFDLIILHTMLLMRRLRKNGADAAGISQALLNLMFADMDRNLREMGVGDLSVGKQVKKMAKAFYGRSETWEKGLDAQDGSARDDAADNALVKAFTETVYRSVDASQAKPTLLAAYARTTDAQLVAQPIDDILSGTVSFDAVIAQQPAA